MKLSIVVGVHDIQCHEFQYLQILKIFQIGNIFKLKNVDHLTPTFQFLKYSGHYITKNSVEVIVLLSTMNKAPNKPKMTKICISQKIATIAIL